MPVDLVLDFSNYAFMPGSTGQMDFYKNMSEIVKPDCPVTLNKVYGLFKAGYQVEEKAFNGLLNDTFYKLKDVLVNSCFLAGLVIFVGFLVLNYQKFGLITVLIFIFFYFVFWFCILFFVNPKFTDLVTVSLKSTISLSQLEADDLSSRFGPYFPTYSQLNEQAKNAVCN